MNLVEAIRKLLTVFASTAWHLFRKNVLSIAMLTGVIALFFTVYREYRENRTLKVSFLSSPRSSKAASESREIAQQANSLPTRLGIGRRYSIHPIYTGGFLDNYQGIASPGSDLCIGYSLDGLCNEWDSRAKLLLPLEDNYVHFMCRNEFLDDCWNLNQLSAITDLAATISAGEAASTESIRLALQRPRPTTEPYTLTKLRDAIKTAKGMRSTIRYRLKQLAEQANRDKRNTISATQPNLNASSPTQDASSEKEEDTINQQAAPGPDLPKVITGQTEEQILWEIVQAAEAVVDARFYLGPTDSGSREIANQVFQHIRLSPGEMSTTGILSYTEMRRALRDRKIAGGLLVATLSSATVGGVAKDGKCSLVSIDTALGIDAGGSATNVGLIKQNTYHRANPSFCPENVVTIKTRRLLIASEDLSTGDAFKIARVAANYYGIDPTDEAIWKDAEGHPTSGHLRFRRHPATYALEEGVSPRAWLFWEHPLVQTIAPALLLAVLINGITYATSLLPPTRESGRRHQSRYG